MKHPIIIVGYNRPEYLEKCIIALSNQVEGHEVILFLDKPLSTQDESHHDRQVEFYRNTFRGKAQSIGWITRPHHFGVGNNMLKIREWAFNIMQFKYCHFIEDDAVLSSNAILLTENLMEWCNRWDNVGAVQVWNRRPWQSNEINDLKNKVKYTHANWFHYLMSKKCWINIHDLIKQYKTRFLDSIPSYMNRDHRAIYNWYQTLADYPIRDNFKNKFPESFKTTWEFRQKFYSSQDHAVGYAMLNRGWAKVSTILPRMETIGQNGMHCNPQSFSKAGFDKVYKYEDNENKNLVNFEISND